MKKKNTEASEAAVLPEGAPDAAAAEETGALPALTPADFETVGRPGCGDSRMVRPTTTFFRDAWRRLKKNRVAMGALVLLLLILLAALLGPVLSPYTYSQQDAKMVNKWPGAAHWFGTDALGRDIFTRCWMGARVSLFIAFVSAVINVVIGVLYGGISGYFGGRTDLFMMRFVEIIYSVPDLLWVILLMVVMGAGLKTIIIAIAITGWGSMARIVRGQVLGLRQSEYVLAARTLGGSAGHIIWKHLLPNLMGPIIIELTFSIPSAIFAEATLSYLGLGVPVPLASWGTLANDGANMLLLLPYQLLFPALLISLTMLGFNLLGDGLRDALDPRLRR